MSKNAHTDLHFFYFFIPEWAMILRRYLHSVLKYLVKGLVWFIFQCVTWPSQIYLMMNHSKFLLKLWIHVDRKLEVVLKLPISQFQHKTDKQIYKHTESENRSVLCENNEYFILQLWNTFISHWNMKLRKSAQQMICTDLQQPTQQCNNNNKKRAKIFTWYNKEKIIHH